MASERLALALLAAALLSAGTAHAEPSAADRETARALMKEGDQRMSEANAAHALRAYQAAHGIMNVPPTGMAVVRALTQLGRLVEARDVALQVIRSPVQDGESPVFTKAREDAAAAAKNLETRIAGLVVKVEGARVTIDGVELASDAIGLVRKVDPGKHAIEIQAPGHRDARIEVTLGEGETREISPVLERLEEPVAPAPAPPPPRVERVAARPAAPAESPGAGRYLLIGGASAAVLGIAVGSITGFMAIQRSDELRSSCPESGCPPSRQDDYDAAKRLATVSNVSFALGAVGLGVGIYGYFLSQSDSAPKAARPAVWPLAGPGAVGVGGRF